METKVSFFSNLKTIPKNNFKKWQFWYKTIAMLLIFGVLLSALIVDLVNLATLKTNVDQWLLANSWRPRNLEFWAEFNKIFVGSKGIEWLRIPNSEPILSQIDYGGFIINHFSFFTVLSNFAIGFWFLFAILKPQKEGVKGYLGYRVTIILATYITITMLIWLGLLMPTNLANGQVMTGMDWFYGLTEHALFPLLFIGYVIWVFKVKGDILSQSSYMKKEWKNIIFVLLGYGAYCLIRGEIRYQGNQPAGTQYPYFFLQIHATKVNGLPGIVWFIIAILLISLISVGFSSGYNKIIFMRQNKMTLTNVNR